MIISNESTLVNKRSKLGRISDKLSLWNRRYRRGHKCVSSNSVILILFWSFSVSLIYNSIFEGGNYLFSTFSGAEYYSFLYAPEYFIMCFYPLAGFLADTRYGRFRMINRSSQLLLLSIFLGIVIAGFVILYNFLPFHLSKGLCTFFLILLCLLLIPLAVLIIATLVVFNANIIQFGIDQLQDSPADHQSLFIHWYVWTYYLSVFIAQVGWSSIIGGLGYRIFINKIGFWLILPLLICLFLLLIVVLIVHYKKLWFLIDTARTNPYMLVYQVTKFARQHKVPVCRSAFTYCEDDIPSGLDLGKAKYGGPFTTEEVENVKAFYGILRILLAFGMIWFMTIASNSLLSSFTSHVTGLAIKYNFMDDSKRLLLLLFKEGFLSSLIVVFFLPVYIFLIRPFTNTYKMRIFVRIGMGAVLLLLSVTSTFVTDTTFHTRNITQACMLSEEFFFEETFTQEKFHPTVLLPQRILYGLSLMLIYPALYEFICAQSPHSMKGLFIGLSFAVRGLFELLASLLLIPFTFPRQTFPSCGMEYYMLVIVVGVASLAVFVYVARKYKLRERDEPCHVRRFVEDYYSKMPEETLEETL